MRTIGEDFFANKLTPQNGTFGRTGRTESTTFAGKRKQVFLLTSGAADTSKAVLDHAVIQVLCHHRADHNPQFAVVLFKSMIVFAHEPIKIMKQDRIERTLLGCLDL